MAATEPFELDLGRVALGLASAGLKSPEGPGVSGLRHSVIWEEW